MSVLTFTPGTLQQSSFSKVGYGQKYESVYFTKGNYTVKNPIKLNSGTTITGDVGAVLNLIAKAPTSTFGVRVPIFGQVEKYIEDISIENIKFNGHADKQSVKHGKGYHNFIEFSRAKNIKIQNVIIENTQGDGARFVDSVNIEYLQNTVLGCGHDGLYVDRCKNVLGQGNVTYLRSNSALRCKGSDNVIFRENTVLRTDDFSPAYSPGIQVQNTVVSETSKNIEICNNFISGTFGPGIWCAGFANKDIQAASGLNIHNNLITNCGNMPYGNKISGVGGVVVDGWNGEIKNNTIDKCKGYGILIGSYLGSSAGSGYEIEVSRNIITNTKVSRYPGLYSGGAVVNLTPSKTTVRASENCLWKNLTDYYNIDVSTRMDADPLYVSSEDYHLQSKAGHWTENGFVKDSFTSPCIFPTYEYGAYDGTEQHSLYYYPPRPSVVIPRASERDLKAFVQALREGGYLEEEDEISFQNVSEDFTI